MTMFDAARLPGELPGEELVSAGLDSLRRREETIESLLVSIGAPRLRLLGLEIPDPIADPENRLFARLERESDDARSRYSALIRRLVSFEQAAECLL